MEKKMHDLQVRYLTIKGTECKRYFEAASGGPNKEIRDPKLTYGYIFLHNFLRLYEEISRCLRKCTVSNKE